VKAGRQEKVRAKAANIVSVRRLSHAQKAKKPSRLKAAAISPRKKAVANRTLIAKTQTVRLLQQAERIVRIVQEAIVRPAAEIVDAAEAAAGIVVEVPAEVVARVAGAAAIVVHVVVEEAAVVVIAATAKAR
jgi:hypothetical protein